MAIYNGFKEQGSDTKTENHKNKDPSSINGVVAGSNPIGLRT
ncbi:MAG: hypothetical protein ABIJ21_08015 [Nanoarchaeota archaeon]